MSRHGVTRPTLVTTPPCHHSDSGKVTPMSQPSSHPLTPESPQPRRRRLSPLTWVVLIAVVAIVAALTAWLLGSRSTDSGPAPGPAQAKLTTLTLGASSTTPRFATVRYTCPDGVSIKVCGPEPFSSSVWTKKITVPVGTMVRIQVSDTGPLPPNCWITDHTDHLKYNESNTGDCQAAAEEN